MLGQFSRLYPTRRSRSVLRLGTLGAGMLASSFRVNDWDNFHAFKAK